MPFLRSRALAGSLLAACVLATRVSAQLDPHQPGVAWPANAPRPLPDFDVRLAADGRPADGMLERNAELRTEEALAARAADAAALRARIPMLRIDEDPLFGTPSWVASTARFLTEPLDRFDPADVVRAFVAGHRGLFEVSEDELDLARRTRDYATRDTGTRHLTFQQTIDGVDLFGAKLRANVARRGELINVSSTFLPRPEDGFAPSPVRLSPAGAIRAAAESIGARVTAEPVLVATTHRQRWSSPDFRADRAVTTEFVYFPMSRVDVRPAWRVLLPEIGVGNDYDLIVDASDGRLLWRRNQTQFAAAPSIALGGTQNLTLRVYTLDSPAPGSPGAPAPTGQQFPAVPRTLVTVTPASVPESPNSWIDDGDNDTQGNNVDAHTDLDFDNLPDLPRPTGSPFRVFDFPQDNRQPPSAWREAAVTNLFYYCNRYHDRLYAFGFDEAAGNFQTDNFGRGGLGGDRVDADAQDGGGTDNANFMTPLDGESGRMQQYLFVGPHPDRDSGLDADIVYHEYSHGLSNRLHDLDVFGVQAGGMGEGWGDYFGVSLNAEATDDPDLTYTTGAYSTLLWVAGFVDNYYFGIRRFPYSTDRNKNPMTYADIDPAQQAYPPSVPRSPVVPNTAFQVHNVGSVWCTILLDARARMWRTLGFAANDRLMQLVVDGMKLDPGNPDFLQARDAIVQADLVRYGGVDLADLWTAFAMRGCGSSAISPGGSSSTGIVEAYDVPISFEYPATRPTQLEPNQATTFPVEVRGIGSLQGVTGTGMLHLSVNGGPFVPSPLVETSPNRYDVTLPPSGCLDTLDYYLSTETPAGTSTDPRDPSAETFRATVFTSSVPIFDDDFEANRGWTTSVDGAIAGQWQRGVPVDDPVWAYDPPADGDGSGRCYLTQNATGNTDVDEGSVILTSPTFDLSSGGDFRYRYYLNLSSTEGGHDNLVVEVDDAGGAGPWTAVATHATSGGETWRSNEIRGATLAALGVRLTANMKVRFVATDGDPQSIVEAGVDGFHVERKLCDPGPATSFCAGDGSLRPCPCSNAGATGNGCENSVGTGGARLSAAGTTSPDSVIFTVVGETPSGLTTFFQGDASVAPVAYGDGLRCVGGSLLRLYTKPASAGQAIAPAGAEPSVTARSAGLGDPIQPGSTRHYTCAYRDGAPRFCPAPAGNTFNSSNALSIVW